MNKKTILNTKRLSPQDFIKTKKNPIILVLDNIRSAHNVGAAFRISDAFCLEQIYLCGISPTPPHPQIHKTALGAEQVMHWEYTAKTSHLITELRQRGYFIVGIELVKNALSLEKWQSIHNKKPVAAIFGHEVFGISQDVLASVDICVEIPQYGTKLSMNVATCMGIVVWEFLKYGVSY